MIPQLLSPSAYLLQIKVCLAAAALYALYHWVNAPDPQVAQARARAEMVEADARARALAASRAIRPDRTPAVAAAESAR
ncbi:MAG: hypothetical protein ACKOPM_01240 [Novosphingobium sp.]